MWLLIAKGSTTVLGTCAGSRETMESKFFRRELDLRSDSETYYVLNVVSGTVFTYCQTYERRLPFMRVSRQVQMSP